MGVLVYIYLFLLGTILGSFYGVVGTRLPQNKSIIKPASHCEHCNHALKWYDLIPIISYVFTLGKCRYCKKHLSIFYPAIEIGMGLLLCLNYYLFGPVLSYKFLEGLFVFSLCMIIFISDFSYFIILDSPLIITSLATIILKCIFFGYKTALLAILSGLILFAIMYIVKIIGDKSFKRESLGGGDIKLAFVVGTILGFKLGICALILSTFIALPYALLKVYLSEKKEVPFGPFIIGACVLVFIFTSKFNNLLNYLFT